MVALCQTGRASAMSPSTHCKKSKKLALSAPLTKSTMAPIKSSHNTNDISDMVPSSSDQSSELEEEEEEEEQQSAHQKEDHEHQLLHEYTHHKCTCDLTTSPYSLTCGPLVRAPRRSISHASTASSRNRHRRHQLLTSASSNSIDHSSSSPHESLYLEEQQYHTLNPPIHPSDHMKTLLSQLGSSTSASKAAFALMRASSSPCASAEDAYNRAQKSMAEELQTLAGLHMRLHSLIQEHDFGMKQQVDSSYVERQDAMLKSYEGIISRFHDEIRRKDAVTEALKETLAKSMLKGEKLQQRVKALEGKLYP